MSERADRAHALEREKLHHAARLALAVLDGPREKGRVSINPKLLEALLQGCAGKLYGDNDADVIAALRAEVALGGL